MALPALTVSLLAFAKPPAELVESAPGWPATQPAPTSHQHSDLFEALKLKIDAKGPFDGEAYDRLIRALDPSNSV